MIRFTLVFALLLNFQISKGQEIKFGKIDKEALQEKYYERDSTTSVAYLYKFRHTYFQFRSGGLYQITEIQERIKFYDKNGFDYATKVIDLYKKGADIEKVTDINGFTYNLVDGKIEVTKIDKDNYFKVDMAEHWNQLKIAMPKVKEGSVIEYKYQIVSPFYSNIDQFVIQDDIPSKKVDMLITFLSYFKFNILKKGFSPIQPTKTERYDNRAEMDLTSIVLRDKFVPALKKEAYVSNIENYRSAFKFEIISIKSPNYSENLARTWEDVAKIIHKNSRFGNQLQRNNYFESELDELLIDVKESEDLVSVILAFVKKKVKWNKRNGVLTDNGTRKAYLDGVGNVADINLMLVSMLRYADIEAYPVVTSTRDHGIPLYPTLDGLNYVIVAVKDKDDYILLDATESYSAKDILPERVLNWEGRLITKAGDFVKIDLMPKKLSSTSVFMKISLNEDRSVNGIVQERFSNQNALRKRKDFYASDKELYITELEENLSDIEISNFQLKDNDNLLIPVVRSYEFYREDMVGEARNELFFRPLFYLASSENPFKSDKRDYPVDYIYPWHSQYNINIEIPNGYELKTLPESKALSLPNGFGSFKYSISSKEQMVTLICTISINAAVIEPALYPALKEFYKEMLEKQAELVVLKKI